MKLEKLVQNSVVRKAVVLAALASPLMYSAGCANMREGMRVCGEGAALFVDRATPGPRYMKVPAPSTQPYAEPKVQEYQK